MSLSKDYTPPEKVALTESSLPDINSLTGMQKDAYEEMRAYLRGERDEQYRAIAFKGYAGTGKTYTISNLVKEMIIGRYCMVALTAPTNKAVKVLRKITNYKHRLLVYKTIHSLLGLKEDIDQRTGVVSFKKSYDDNSKIAEISVLIIDEASMLPDDLFAMVDEEIEGTGLRIIYMGDPSQIPPVGKADCIPFTPRKRTRFKIKEIELTEVIRQKEGNPILELATTVRENLTSEEVPYNYKTHITSQGGIIMINSQDKEKMFEVCDHYFTNSRFEQDQDFMKVIAWTNKSVNWMNEKIRYLIYKNIPQEQVKKIMIGEKLIADSVIFAPNPSPVTGKPEILYTTNDEFEVESFTLETIDVFGNFHVQVYRCNTFILNEEGKHIHKTIDIVHEGSEEIYKQVVALLKKQALDEPIQTRNLKWRIFYAVQNKFAEVKYNYAITAHKSQGSTYDNCMVIDKDIDCNRNIVERNRIKYVAYTRSRGLLFIVK